MENQFLRMKELKNSREKSIKKLTKALKTLVNLEWEISAVASKTNDNISKLSMQNLLLKVLQHTNCNFKANKHRN